MPGTLFLSVLHDRPQNLISSCSIARDKNMKASSLKSDHRGCTRQTRSAVWQARHRQLLRPDAQYRKRFHAYLTAIVCPSCILLVFYLPFFGVRLFAPAVDIAMIPGLAVVIVGLALSQFHYQRKSIRRFLESSHAA